MELRERMPVLSRALDRDLVMHAGLAVGEVIVGASGGGYNAIGEAVNLAARLTDLAPPGEIFVPARYGLRLRTAPSSRRVAATW